MVSWPWHAKLTCPAIILPGQSVLCTLSMSNYFKFLKYIMFSHVSTLFPLSRHSCPHQSNSLWPWSPGSSSVSSGKPSPVSHAPHAPSLASAVLYCVWFTGLSPTLECKLLEGRAPVSFISILCALQIWHRADTQGRLAECMNDCVRRLKLSVAVLGSGFRISNSWLLNTYFLVR